MYVSCVCKSIWVESRECLSQDTKQTHRARCYKCVSVYGADRAAERSPEDFITGTGHCTGKHKSFTTVKSFRDELLFKKNLI